MGLIAGHKFSATGFCEYMSADSTQPCGKTFSDIACVTKEDIGKDGWAHRGALNETEYQEIIAEVERVWAAHTGQSKVAKAV